MIKDIAFTCYPTKNLEAARVFYEQILGLKPSPANNEFWQEYEIGSGFFTIGMAPADAPEYFHRPAASLALEVENLDATVAILATKGVKPVYGPLKFPNCSMLMIEDADKNIVTLHQLKA